MTLKFHLKTITLGFALFSMFFGAGNVVFPLIVGKITGSNIGFALAGLFITAVFVPFFGLYTATLFEGCHKRFFSPIGSILGFILASLILGLLGPFGVIPRCVALSQATFHLYFPESQAFLFNLFSCLLIYVFTLKPNSVVSLLGNILTPILITVLMIIIVVGLFYHPSIESISTITPLNSMLLGITEGYQTMDLLAALFFASFIISWLKNRGSEIDKSDWKLCSRRAILLAGSLLGSVYVGFGLLSASYGHTLEGVAPAELLGAISGQVLGDYAGLVVCLAVCLACLTTAISLAGIFSEFLRKDIGLNKLSYHQALLFTVIITFIFSLLEFGGIASFLAPILSFFYPFLIALTFFNFIRFHSKKKVIHL